MFLQYIWKYINKRRKSSFSTWRIHMIIKINKELQKEINIKKYLTEIFEKVKKFKTPIIILTIIYLFAMIAIIRADFNYIDDIGRVCEGYKRVARLW